MPHVQTCLLLISNFCVFAVLVAVAVVCAYSLSYCDIAIITATEPQATYITLQKYFMCMLECLSTRLHVTFYFLFYFLFALTPSEASLTLLMVKLPKYRFEAGPLYALSLILFIDYSLYKVAT